MKIHEQTAGNTQTTQAPVPPKQGGSGSLLTSIGAVLVVAVLIAVSITVFTLWRAGKGPGSTPPQGQWKTVLNGYVVSSLVAAHNNPATVYVCAAYTGNSNVVSSDMTYRISRSTDSGNNWQTSQASGDDSTMKGFCQLAVNPNNSNDVYAVGGISTAQQGVALVLKHSTDGGQTWTVIQPVMHFPVPGPAQTAINWQVRQIAVVDNTLFGLQWVAGQAGPPRVPGVKSGSLPSIFYAMPRLTKSTDGGHNWSVIDKDISVTPRGVRSYAVDPTNAQTLYALVDTSWWSGGPMPGAPNERDPNNYGGNGTLYKTTNGGNTWKPILKNLRYGTEVQLASGKPDMLYVGGLNVPMPLSVQPAPATGVDQGQGNAATYPTTGTAVYGFHLQVSKNGGASWQGVAAVPDQFGTQSWFVGVDGRLYAASSSSSTAGPQPTAIGGTVVPSGTSAANGVQRTVQAQASTQLTGSTPTPSTGTTTPGKVIRYDPASNSWQTVTQFVASGSLLTVTASGNNSGAVLWLAGVVNGKAVLSRYVA